MFRRQATSRNNTAGGRQTRSRVGWSAHRAHSVFVCLAAGLAGLAGSAAAQPPPASVTVAPIEERDLPAAIRLVGTVLAERSAVVAAEIGGSVETFDALEGRFVQRGEILCRIDPAPSQYALDEARGRLEALRAQLLELENGTRPEVLAELRAQMEEAAALLEKWEFERKRVDDLFTRNQASSKEKNDTDQEFLAAQRRLAQTSAAYEAAVNGPRKEVIARAQADVAAQEAVVRRLERDRHNADVRAPFDGFIVAKRTEVGEWIAAGGAVCEMVAINTVKVRADAPESAIPFARPGEPAGVRIEALGRVLEAPIARVIPRANASARTYPVEIDLPNAEHELLPGMFVWAYIPAGPSGVRLVVDKDALVTRGGVQQVFVVRPGDNGATMAFPTPVTTGREWESSVEIRGEGLKAGDLVVIRGNERLYGPSPVLPRGGLASPPPSDAAAEAGEKAAVVTPGG